MTDSQIKTLERYRALNQTTEKGQIVFAGSSLMEQFPIERFAAQDTLPFAVYNRGISGIVTQELLECIYVCILDLAPKKLFINIGTNDFNVPQTSVEALVERYAKILNIVKEQLPDCHIYMMAYYPMNAAAAPEAAQQRMKIRTNEKLGRANAALARLADEKGATFLDVNAPITDERGNMKAEFCLDGIHMKEEGYRSIYPLLKPYMTE
ncbi:MAG: lysophospholipase [Clostridia bacterium]|nr:lysophospholipase [Clostridia bacterium]